MEKQNLGNIRISRRVKNVECEKYKHTKVENVKLEKVKKNVKSASAKNRGVTKEWEISEGQNNMKSEG